MQFRPIAGVMLAGILGLGVTLPVVAHTDNHAAHAQSAPETSEDRFQAVDITLLDLELVNRDRRRLRFVSDVLGDRLAVVTVMYTSCTTVCPISSAIFEQLQNQLGDRLENEVRLVSLTVDPSRDNPALLDKQAQKFHAKNGWYWLTGSKTNVDRVLEGMGAYSLRYTEHPPTVLVGDPVSNKWFRLYGFPSPGAVMDQIDALLAQRKQ